MTETVKTVAGKVRGEAIPNGVAFRGIPFAEPPTLRRRAWARVSRRRRIDVYRVARRDRAPPGDRANGGGWQCSHRSSRRPGRCGYDDRGRRGPAS
ncbi:MAG TPA: hypothetical protein DEH11_09610 [Actinobacteria bacterium]|nr:hypothetical protein [Actinomycetota bacterium]